MANKHATCAKIDAASTDMKNDFAELDVAGMWGDGHAVAVDGSQIDTWDNNILAETSVQYGGRRDRVPAHLRHLHRPVLPVYPVRGVGGRLHHRRLAAQRTPTSGRTPSTPTPRGSPCRYSGSPRCSGSTCCPRIHNWQDLNRPTADATYQHIDALFGDNVIDWGLIAAIHWTDLLRTAISIREGRLSSVPLLRQLRNNSHKNRLYQALRELGRVIRTATLGTAGLEAAFARHAVRHNLLHQPPAAAGAAPDNQHQRSDIGNATRLCWSGKSAQILAFLSSCKKV